MPGPRAAVSTRAIVSAVVVASLVLGAVTVPAVGGSGSHADGSLFAQTDVPVDADAVLLSVDVRPDGSADWRVAYRVQLDDDDTTAAFDELQAAVDANESAYVSRFEDRMTATVRDAESATGRVMGLRNVSVSTTTEQLPQTYGVLVYAFEWAAFAEVEGDQIRAGDALVGLFLDTDSTLLVSWPEGYAVVDVSPSPTEQREHSVLWRGPTDFGPREPDLVLSKEGGPGNSSTSPVGLAIVASVLLGGGTLIWWRSRSGRDGAATPLGRSHEAAAPDDASARPPDELLSNEERVSALLEAHGGRVKQQDVVEAFGWTEAKTSGVVGKMRESGQIDGFRLGRENVLQLPEADDATTSEDVSTSNENPGA